MGGGGKGGSTVAPTPVTYIDPITGKTYKDAVALNAAIDARLASEKAISDANTTKIETQKAADLAAFNARSTSAYDQSRTNIENYFRSIGVDPTLFNTDITNTLNTKKQQVPQLDPNPLSVYGENLGQSIANQISSGVQSRARSSLDSLFGSNYASRELPLELIDPIIEQVLGSQFDPLNTQLQNAVKRRTLTEPGLAGAQNQLNADRSAGKSTVSRLGTNVIFSDRGDVNNFLGSAYESASKIPLASANLFDPNSFYNEAESRTDRYRSNLHGDVLNALGDTQLSNIQRLLNAGGIAQGANDPTATNPSGAIGVGGGAIGGAITDPNYLAQQILQKKPRGLGTQGAF